MKRFFSIFFLSCLVTVSATAQYKDNWADLGESETVTRLKEHVEMLSSFDMQGRKAGSEGEKKAAEYVYDALSACGVDMLTPREGNIFGISSGADTLKSRNVFGFVQGYDRELAGHYIVIGARLDNLGTDSLSVEGEKRQRVYYGANGNASGLAMMLELAKKISSGSFLFRRSVLFVAFGASQERYAGAWYFLNRDFRDVKLIDAMINLDMLGAGASSFQAYTASNRDMNKILEAAAGELQPVLPELTTQEAYPSDHRAFYSASIPSVFFSTGRYNFHDSENDAWYTLDYEGMERELEYLFNFSKTLCCVEVAPSFNRTKVDAAAIAARTYAWYDCDRKPTFFDRADPRVFLDRWVYQYIKYPPEAVKNGIQGRVTVEFTVSEKGKVEDVVVKKGVHELLDAEAVRVVEASPDWKPGKVKGVAVRAVISVPIEFRLDKKGKGRFSVKNFEKN